MATEMNHGGYVQQSDRNSAWGPFSSLRVLWTRIDNKNIYGAYERPPFPIKIDAPTIPDIMGEMRLSDAIMFGTLYGVGIGWAYLCSRPFTQLMQRLVVFHGVSHLIMVSSLCLTISMPYRRLTGYTDNGLRWSIPEDRLKKFDSTSHFESATIWGRFRVKKDE